jgi:hypothetical protein
VHDVRALLLRRTGQLFLEPFVSTSGDPSPESPPGVRALEADLVELGFVLSRELVAALSALPARELDRAGRFLDETLAPTLGADRAHVPLFRRFPDDIPENTGALYVRRVLAWLLQEPEQPCVLCGAVREVSTLDPCGHLVCGVCFDRSNYSGCPICHRRLHPEDPFLYPMPPSSRERRAAQEDLPPRGRLTRISLGTDLHAAGLDFLRRLVARSTPLSPDDQDALQTLLHAYGHKALGALPERIPVKETMATVFGTLLQDPRGFADTFTVAARYLQTATDVLRVFCVWMGAKPDLITPQRRVRSPPRALRRGLVDVLERFSLPNLVEDLGRHASLWKRVAEKLHPFERAAKTPKVTCAFAVLRGTKIEPGTPFGRVVLAEAARHPGSFIVEGGQLRYRSWASLVERAMAKGAMDEVLRLLAQRPGELMRRLDHVLRRLVAPHPERLAALSTTLSAALPRAASPLLLTVLAHLRKRRKRLSRRVFFPKAEVMHAWGTGDRRPVLPADLIAASVDCIERELLCRAGSRPELAASILDEGLADLLVPFAERSASRALVAIPRGSLLPIPEGERIRLFLHWTQPEGDRSDLDLSVALFDEAYRFVGLCDFTNLVLGPRAAVHSGDLTSAPPPLGASEFVDLDLPKLAALGARWLVFVVLSFNSLPFDVLPDAFAGFLVAPAGAGPFDARAVEQRFDLQGNAKIAVPLLVDLVGRRMRWVDVKVPADGTFHSVDESRAALAHLASDVTHYFGAGARPTLWELSCLLAAARTPVVHVRRRNGRAMVFRRGATESTQAFFRMLAACDAATAEIRDAVRLDGAAPVFFAGLVDDLPLPAGSVAYALRFRGGSGEGIRRLAAADLLTDLAAPSA